MNDNFESLVEQEFQDVDFGGPGDHVGDLRVYWFVNPPSTPKHYPVKSPEEAKAKLDKLAQRDLRDSSVFDNAGGLQVYEEGEWTEWYDENGNDIDYEEDDWDDSRDESVEEAEIQDVDMGDGGHPGEKKNYYVSRNFGGLDTEEEAADAAFMNVMEMGVPVRRK